MYLYKSLPLRLQSVFVFLYLYFHIQICVFVLTSTSLACLSGLSTFSAVCSLAQDTHHRPPYYTASLHSAMLQKCTATLQNLPALLQVLLYFCSNAIVTALYCYQCIPLLQMCSNATQPQTQLHPQLKKILGHPSKILTLLHCTRLNSAQ